MNFLKKDQFKSPRIIGEPFEVVLLGGYVNIKKWSGLERANNVMLLAQMADNDDLKDIAEGKKTTSDLDNKTIPKLYETMCKIIMSSLCDESGEFVFSNDDLDILKSLDGDVIDILFKEITTRNGINQETAIPEATKNLETTQSKDSTLNLPESWVE